MRTSTVKVEREWSGVVRKGRGDDVGVTPTIVFSREVDVTSVFPPILGSLDEDDDDDDNDGDEVE